MPRKLAHEDGDVEERAETAQVAQIALARCAAQSLDVGLEVERRAVDVPNAWLREAKEELDPMISAAERELAVAGVEKQGRCGSRL